MAIMAVLALEDGSIFKGNAIGAIDSVEYSCGEIVFNTSITGYQEIISDPSYCEQIILFTQPHIGNVGVNSHDSEASNSDNLKEKIWSKGIIVKSLSKVSSNWRAENDLNKYLIENKLIGIENIDTRALTIMLRTKGAMRACIYVVKDSNINIINQIAELAIQLAQKHRSLAGLDLAKVVTTGSAYSWNKDKYSINHSYYSNDKNESINQHKKFKVVVYDFGVKQQILKLLVNRNCDVTVVPAATTVSDVLKYKPNGILLSNGPGDPAACNYAIANTKELIKLGYPIFGICLGFQILALALGGKTEKMKFGHHGGNHPVKNLEKNTVMITSQNHGFMVNKDSLSSDIIITNVSLFDNTIQGFKHKSLPIFGFQGHPEASPGPVDIEHLFDDFINYMRSSNISNRIIEEQVNI